MKLIRHHDLPAFTDHVRPWLLEHECENCFQLGALGSPPDAQSDDPASLLPILMSIETAAGLAGVGLQLHAFGFSASRMPPEGVELIASALAEMHWPATGVVGPVEVADPLSERLSKLRGWERRVHLGLRVFQLTHVTPPPPVSGKLIPATMEHVDRLTEWVDAYGKEIGEPHDNPGAHARNRLGKGQLYLWQSDHEPRSLAGVSGPTPNGIRVNQVYTPPTFRGRGYASNLVAALSQHLLDSGRTFCFLFTDLANPTSSKIYQQIGYEPISAFRHWRFD